MPRTWDRSRCAPWLLRELVQVNEKPRVASAAERDEAEPLLAAASFATKFDALVIISKSFAPVSGWLERLVRRQYFG